MSCTIIKTRCHKINNFFLKKQDHLVYPKIYFHILLGLQEKTNMSSGGTLAPMSNMILSLSWEVPVKLAFCCSSVFHKQI